MSAETKLTIGDVINAIVNKKYSKASNYIDIIIKDNGNFDFIEMMKRLKDYE